MNAPEYNVQKVLYPLCKEKISDQHWQSLWDEGKKLGICVNQNRFDKAEYWSVYTERDIEICRDSLLNISWILIQVKERITWKD